MYDYGRIRTALVVSLSAACASMSIDSTTHADVVTANYVNDNLFSYRIDHMPDLDQKRSGLDGNGGYHCVPTATMNILAYAANHGFPDVDPGPKYWQAQENHEEGTVWIWGMGIVMQTSYDPGDPNADPPIGPSGGTGGSSATAGLTNWLEPYDYFVINNHLTLPGYSTTFANIAKSLIGGNIGTMSYGRYDILGEVKGLLLVQRDGGHATTVVRCVRNGSTNEIWVRDPADNTDSINQQSPFFNRIMDVTDMTVVLMDQNDPPGPVDVRTMSALNYDPTSNRVALIDGHRTIRPKSGYSFDSSLSVVQLNTPNSFTGSQTPGQHQVPVPSGGIVDVNFSAILGDFVAIIGDAGDRALYRINPLNSTHEMIALPATPKLLEASSDGRHFVVTTDGRLRRLSANFEPEIDVQLPGDPVAAGGSFSFNYTEIEWDYPADASRPPRLVLASMQARNLAIYTPDLDPPQTREIPTVIPGSLLDLAVEPSDGRVWFCVDATDVLYGVLWAADGSVNLEFLNNPAIANPTSVKFDDAGRMYVCSNGDVAVLRRTGPGNSWDTVSDSPFRELACGENFRMMRHSNNYDPAFHDNPAWVENIDPDELDQFGKQAPDCSADLNGDNLVDVSDLLMLLGVWGECEVFCAADLTIDGNVDVSDLLDLLADWGVCP